MLRDPDLSHPSHHLLVQAQCHVHVPMLLSEPVLVSKLCCYTSNFHGTEPIDKSHCFELDLEVPIQHWFISSRGVWNHPVTIRGFMCPLLNVGVVLQGHGRLCLSPSSLRACFSKSSLLWFSAPCCTSTEVLLLLHVGLEASTMCKDCDTWTTPARIITQGFLSPRISLPISHNPPMCYITECDVGQEGMYS